MKYLILPVLAFSILGWVLYLSGECKRQCEAVGMVMQTFSLLGESCVCVDGKRIPFDASNSGGER